MIRICGACGREIPEGGSSSCGLDHAVLCTEDIRDFDDRNKRKQLAKKIAEWNYWSTLAKRKGWKLPGNSRLPSQSWINYWQGMQRHEDDPSCGRPVIPHRSASAYPEMP